MALMWHNMRRIFWINFSKPQRKLGLLFRDGLQVVPRNKNGRKFHHAQHSQYSRSRPFLVTASKYFSQTALTRSNIGYRSIITPESIRWFHTTRRLNIPPVLWVFLKPLGKLWAMLWGRYTRNWWAALSPEKKGHYKSLFGGMKGIIFGVVIGVLTAALINYVVHLQRNPLTNRLRFISLSEDQISTIVTFEEQTYMTQYKDKLVKNDDPVFQTVTICAQRILDANQKESPMFSAVTWKVTVIDDLSVNNAFVLPNGHIFVFTGLLNNIKNIDQLAIILGHEIAHAVMGHSIEHVSRGQLLDVVMIAALAAIWTFVPGDGIAIITQWFYNKLMKLMLDLPYSRDLESEADEIGLLFAAKACYDVREAPALWAWQDATLKYSEKGSEIPEFLSTHPAHESRTQTLQQLLPKALQLREECACSKLDPLKDPWARVNKEIECLKASKEKADLKLSSS